MAKNVAAKFSPDLELQFKCFTPPAPRGPTQHGLMETLGSVKKYEKKIKDSRAMLPIYI